MEKSINKIPSHFIRRAFGPGNSISRNFLLALFFPLFWALLLSKILESSVFSENYHDEHVTVASTGLSVIYSLVTAPSAFCLAIGHPKTGKKEDSREYFVGSNRAEIICLANRKHCSITRIGDFSVNDRILTLLRWSPYHSLKLWWSCKD